MAPIFCWDLELPENWQVPEWESARLVLKQVPQPVLRCCQCGTLIKVIPSFLVQGTKLTLSALIFVALAYEASELTWRELPQKFCDPVNRMAHSTLYKAVQALGRFIHSDAEFRKLCEEHLPAVKTIPGWPIPHWPPPKSIYTHTVIREKGVRLLLRFLWPYQPHIPEILGYFLSALERLFVNSKKQIPMLYPKEGRKKDRVLNTA
ncbi:hypothetical protein [Acididesulfobacillus acetoxydans]|nr:hypothetical protein [Acididesulfobacillus acetoxydans]